MLPFSTYLNESDGDSWVTIHHQHVLIGPDGTIKAGLGGKFNGKSVQHAIDTLNSQAKEKSAKKSAPKEKAEKPKSKMQHAIDIVKNASPNALAKDIKKQLISKLGLTPAAASTYYHNIKKKLGNQKPEEPVDKKEESSNNDNVAKKVEDSKKIIKDLQDKHGDDFDVEKAITAVKDQLNLSHTSASALVNAALKKKQKDDIEYPEQHISDIVDIIKDNPHATPAMLVGHIKDWYKVSEKSASEMYDKAFNKLHGEKKFKNVDDTIKHEYDKVVKDKGSVKSHNELYDVFKKVKEQHPEMGIAELSAKVSNYHNEFHNPKKSYKYIVDKVESKGSKALSVKEISNYSTENEVLLNRGTKFRIIGKQQGKNQWGDPINTIYCEAIVD